MLQKPFLLKNFTPISSNEKLFTSPTNERFASKNFIGYCNQVGEQLKWFPQEVLLAYTVFSYLHFLVPIPVTARAKAWDRSRSLAEIVDSNPACGMDVSLLRVLCAVRQRSL